MRISKQKNCSVEIAGFSAFPTELFVFSYIQLHPAYTIAHFSRQYGIGNFAEPLFAEIGVSVIAIKVCDRKYNSLGIVTLLFASQ